MRAPENGSKGEPGLHVVHGSRFTGSGGRRVDRLIFRVYVRHRTLKRQAYSRWRGSENRLPAHCTAAIRHAREAGKRKLAASLRAAGECLVVEAEAYVA